MISLATEWDGKHTRGKGREISTESVSVRICRKGDGPSYSPPSHGRLSKCNRPEVVVLSEGVFVEVWSHP